MIPAGSRIPISRFQLFAGREGGTIFGLLMLSIALPFTVALLVSLALVPVARLVSVRLGYVATPRADRWHKRPVALFGGVAMALTLFLCAAGFGLVTAIPVLVVTAGATFLTGFVDDVVSLKPSTKLIAQIALASTLLFFDYRLNWLHSITFDGLLTLIWIVGLTNAFNLIDNMDGLCGGIAMVVGAALLIDLLPGAAGTRAFFEVRYLAILLGATGGFLVYNLHPASIFMGDAGSLLLGFSFAAVTLSGGRQTPGRSDVLSIVAGPVLVLLIPILDTTLVTVSRALSGRGTAQGGRDHSSHRLVAIGLSERRAVALLWALAAVGGALGVGVGNYSQKWSVLLTAFAFLIAMVLFAAYLAGIRVYDEADVRAKPGAFTPIVVEFMYKRRVAEVVLDFCLVVMCYYAAYRMRFEDPVEFMMNFQMFTRSLPVIVGAQMIAFFAVGVYRGIWRHFGMMDTLVVARGVGVGVMLAMLVILGAFRFFAYSRTVFAIYAVLMLIAVTLSRASFRLVGEFMQRQRQSGRRVVIYGAGDAAGLLVRELMASGIDMRVSGFIDDDPRKGNVRVMGYPVLGGYSALVVLVKASSVDLVAISARSLPPERMHNLEVLCNEHNVGLVRLRVSLEALVDAEERNDEERRAQVRHLRPV
jgi:UDP-GlcNAc:undecaprenyl-phosphate GlcNAc-1-phosphate transferase